MEEDFSLLKLLQSGQEGINELQSTIDGSGITIDCPRSNFYYLDFGVTANDELKYETDIPLGYEESITEQDKKIVAKTLKLTSAFPYTIRRIDVLPSNNEKLPEISVLVDDEDILLSHKALNLKPHQELELKVLCKVNPGYFGFLGRWIIFLFERKWKPSMTKCQVESFVFGIRLQGCVTRDKSSRIQLSSEARAFIPQASIIYFEEQSYQFSFHYLLNKYQNGKYAPKLQAPSNFLTVVNELRRICFPPDDFSVGYIRACRARAVEAFALTCAIQISKAPVGANSEVERSAGWDPLRTPEAVIKYLQGLGKMTWMEEAQMTMDVAQYDMHFVTLKPLEKFPPRSQNQTITLIGSETERVFTCKLVVKGSSESRPRICIGDKVRLRPTKEGLLYLNSACPRQVSMFELEGIILAYTLASETCIVEFVSPPREFFWANQLEPSDGVDIWSKITYQARFTFERSGLVFCHLAIADVLNTPGLRKSLFPTELFTAASQTESGSSKASSVGPPSPTRIESSNVTYSNVGSSLFASETSNSLFSSAFTSGPTSGAMPDTVGKSAGPPPGLSEIGVLGPLSGSPTQGKAQNFTSEYGDYYGQNSGTPMTDAETVSTPEVSVDTRFNEEQMTAIRSIVNLPEPNAFTTLPPYIIYGPPGTGKTSTLIEAIVRLHKKHPQKHVLACAPSDAAADVLVQRLKEFYKPSELLRHNWWQRISASVPIEIIQYTKANDAGVFEMPSFEEAKSFRIIVSTCGTAGSLMRLKPTGSVDALPTGTSPATPAALNPGYRALTFDLVVVDEASQATEAETYIPLSMCRSDGAGLMVLAGDPQQLGPMTRSSIFSIWGGPTSLQERMLSLPPYRIQEGTNGANTALNSLYGIGTQQSMVCFLTKNYRSHHHILKISSRLFYHDAMQEAGLIEVTHSLLPWNRLAPQRAFPLLFVGVDGQHSHEVDSPSFFNPEEIDEVVSLCKSLLTSTDVKVATQDIGVICAFRSQVLKMRRALRDNNMGGINVGSVEDYQGQEMKVIIISTVLSSRVPALETRGSLGLFGDKKKFNVAISRGMALCIVVGQPYLLYADPCWREFLEYCDQYYSCVGMDCSMLRRHQEAKRESDDEWQLLNMAAQMSVLGGGVGDAFSKDSTSLYINSETQWRVLL